MRCCWDRKPPSCMQPIAPVIADHDRSAALAFGKAAVHLLLRAGQGASGRAFVRVLAGAILEGLLWALTAHRKPPPERGAGIPRRAGSGGPDARLDGVNPDQSFFCDHGGTMWLMRSAEPPLG